MKPKLSTYLPNSSLSARELNARESSHEPYLEPLLLASESYVGRFRAMGSPCEVLMRNCKQKDAQRCLGLIYSEVMRIEHKFSRYRDDNIISEINNSKSRPVKVDDETARLIDTANRLYDISNGLFDITSGCLRRAWIFDRSNHLPELKKIKALLKHVGWNRVGWSHNYITLPPNFEIDFGGIGKEYATDRCLGLVLQAGFTDVLINLGGDIATHSRNPEKEPWSVGVQCTHSPTAHDAMITIGNGGIATSGDTNKYLTKDGVRYSHILDPRTGWSIREAPQSVTVVASNCSEAGMYATLAMLQGVDAEQFLVDSEVKHWIQRQ